MYALQGELPDEETIHKLIRKGTIANKVVPLTCGSGAGGVWRSGQ